MRIFGVNGIWTDGDDNVDRLLYWLATRYGYEIVEDTAPTRNPFTARFSAEKDIEDLVKLAETGDAVVAHSYGCLKTAMAMKKVQFSHVFLFRPAMSIRYKFPNPKTEVHCIHSPDDIAIMLGAFTLLYHPFGNAGRRGFDNYLVTNIETRGGHSADFERLEHWGAYIHNHLKQAR